MYDLIIIGSGPAGLGAAIYGKRAGYSTLVLEKNPMSGGQVLNTCEVDNYLGLPGINGFDLGMQFREHADRLGTEFVEADVTGIKNLPDCKKVLTSAGEIYGKGGHYCSRCGAQKAWRARGKTAGWQRYFLLCDL